MREWFGSARRRWIAAVAASVAVIAPVWLVMMIGGAAAAGEDACTMGLPDRRIRFWPPGIVGDCPEGGTRDLITAGELVFETVFMLAFAVAMAAIVAALIRRWVERRPLIDAD